MAKAARESGTDAVGRGRSMTLLARDSKPSFLPVCTSKLFGGYLNFGYYTYTNDARKLILPRIAFTN